jgi:hypothetical protein
MGPRKSLDRLTDRQLQSDLRLELQKVKPDKLSEISGSHGGEYEVQRLLECTAV